MRDTVFLVRTLVSAQALVTALLAVLLWSLYARLRKPEFDRWWAFAWTLFAVHLGLGRLALTLPQTWSTGKVIVLLVTTLVGFLVAPALVFGAVSLRAPNMVTRRVSLAVLAVTLVLGAVSVAVSLLWAATPLAPFAIRNAPRTLLLAIALFYCARVFFQRASATRSWAARVTGASCLVYGVSQSVYLVAELYFLTRAARGAPAGGIWPLVYSSALLYLDIALTCGICLGMVLILVEEYQRSELELLESVSRRYQVAEENTVLQSEIRQRQEVEQSLRASEDRYRDLVENSEDLLCTHDLDGRLLSCNQAPARILGYEVDEILGKRVQDFLPPEYRHLFTEYAERIARDGIATGVISVVTRDGERRVWAFRNTLRADGAGKGIVRGMGRDVTEQRRAEQAVRRSEEKFAVAFRLSPCAKVILSTTTNRIIDVNTTFESETGYGRAELLGRTLGDVGFWFDPADRDAVQNAQEQQKRLVAREVRVRHKDGHIGTSVLSTEVIDIGRERCILIASLDISARKEAEARHHAILTALPDWVFLMSVDGTFLEFHARDQRYLVVPPREFIGRNVHDVLPPDLAVRMIDCYREALRSDEPATLEYSLPIGDELRYYEVRAVRSVGNQVLCLVRDQTDRKRAEQRVGELQSELAHVGRVTTLGTLTGSLAHEISQPLAAIQTNAFAAQRMLDMPNPDVAEIRSALGDIARDNRRIAEVLRRLRALLKGERREYAAVDANSIVDDVLTLTRSRLIERRVSVRVVRGERLPNVYGDRVQLQQVLLNLLMNAADAAVDVEDPDNRIVTVTTAVSELDEGPQVSIAVTDRGDGVPNAVLDRMFEPFFTTKNEGMGLGLSICRTIMDAHGGRISARRNADRGLTISVVLDAMRPSVGQVMEPMDRALAMDA